VTSVLVAAATAIARAGLEAVIREHSGFTLLAAIPGAVAEQVSEQLPDVVVVDVPEHRLARALAGFADHPPPPAIVVLADDVRSVLEAGRLRPGVRAVLPREASGAEIAAAIEATAAGLAVLHPNGLAALRSTAVAVARVDPDLLHQPLTPRETEILAMMAEGLGNKLIAARLRISSHTVKFHVAAIFAKLGAGSRTEAVTIGVRRGLILI
jgi:DNA-binding NarL/FixJ family response regulator